MLKWINKKRNKKGFTLVELVVVIAILGILAAIAIPRMSGSKNTAKVATHNANVRILKSAAVMFSADHPNETGVLTTGDKLTKFKTYFDSKDLPKTHANEEFTVEIKTDGDIDINPGEVKVDGNNIVPADVNETVVVPGD